jgi:hypothetical protein
LANDYVWEVHTFCGVKKTREVVVEVVLSFPRGFFLGVMVPLYLVHSDGFSSGSPLFLIKDLEGMIDNFGRNSDTFLEL